MLPFPAAQFGQAKAELVSSARLDSFASLHLSCTFGFGLKFGLEFELELELGLQLELYLKTLELELELELEPARLYTLKLSSGFEALVGIYLARFLRFFFVLLSHIDSSGLTCILSLDGSIELNDSFLVAFRGSSLDILVIRILVHFNDIYDK